MRGPKDVALCLSLFLGPSVALIRALPARAASRLALGSRCAPPSRDASLARSSIRASGDDRAPMVLVALNGSSKWLVAGWQMAALLVRRDLAAPFIVIGMVVSSFLCGMLKRALGQTRPDRASTDDPGMPSSHALVATFAASAWACEASALPVSIGLSLVALAVSGLRVVCGEHTLPQVGVGLLLGWAWARGWMVVGAQTGLLALAPGSPPFIVARSWLYGICAVGIALFAARKANKFVGRATK